MVKRENKIRWTLNKSSHSNTATCLHKLMNIRTTFEPQNKTTEVEGDMYNMRRLVKQQIHSLAMKNKQNNASERKLDENNLNDLT